MKQKIEALILEAIGEDVSCEYCGRVFDERCEDYDGVANCICEKGKFQYKHSYHDIGKNELRQNLRLKVPELAEKIEEMYK